MKIKILNSDEKTTNSELNNEEQLILRINLGKQII
jgi:hypothetical protein